LRGAWLDAGSLDEQQRICAEIQMQLWQDVPYIPMGEYWQATAHRKDLLDVLPGAFAVFWGIRRA
jgi:peptide/nickel transport system substrate-binding protein